MWRTRFLHVSWAKLRENTYMIVKPTTHPSLLIWCFKIRDTLCRQLRTFVESLKDTNRKDTGYVDYEKLYGVDGVCLANVSNTKDVEGRGAQKQVKTMITFDDGLSLCFCHPSLI
jgi:hypothetical protein